jgi:hypothetical protein
MQAPTTSSEYGEFLCRTFRYHAWAFWVSNAVLTVANIASGAPWWAVWPFLAWGLVFSIHYFIFKSLTVDESWSDDRIDDLRWRSYDLGHVEDLEDRIRGDDFSTRPAHRRDPDWWRGEEDEDSPSKSRRKPTDPEQSDAEQSDAEQADDRSDKGPNH